MGGPGALALGIVGWGWIEGEKVRYQLKQANVANGFEFVRGENGGEESAQDEASLCVYVAGESVVGEENRGRCGCGGNLHEGVVGGGSSLPSDVESSLIVGCGGSWVEKDEANWDSFRRGIVVIVGVLVNVHTVVGLDVVVVKGNACKRNRTFDCEGFLWDCGAAHKQGGLQLSRHQVPISR